MSNLIPPEHKNPIVVLRRLVEGQSLPEINMEAAMESLRCDDEGSDDDASFPPVPFALAGIHGRRDADAVLKAQGDAILQRYDKKLREDQALERMQAAEAALQQLAFQDKPPHSEDEEEQLEMEKLLIQHNLPLDCQTGQTDILPDVHPGVDIFTFRPTTFTSAQVNFSYLNNPKEPFERMLKSATLEDLEDYIIEDTFALHFGSISDKGGAIRFLFRFLSVFEAGMGRPCQELLEELFKQDPRLIRFVTLELIAEVFLNYGSTLDKLLPTEILRETLFKRLSNLENDGAIDSSELLEMQVEPFSILAVNLSIMSLCKVISVAFCHPQIPREEDDIFSLAVMLMSVSLDSKLSSSECLCNVHMCVDRLINMFTEEQWTQKIGIFCDVLCHMADSHHHNMVFIGWAFVFSSRGYRLQNVIACKMLCLLLPSESPDTPSSRLTPLDILKLIQAYDLRHVDNLYLIYNLLHLIDFAIGTDLPIKDAKSIQSLSTYLGQVSSRIRDNSKCIIGLKVKDLVSQMRNKWRALTSYVPMAQRTMFSYLGSADHTEGDSQDITDVQECN